MTVPALASTCFKRIVSLPTATTAEMIDMKAIVPLNRMREEGSPATLEAFSVLAGMEILAE